MHESPDSGEWLAHAHQDLDNGYQALFFVPANFNIKIGPGDEATIILALVLPSRCYQLSCDATKFGSGGPDINRVGGTFPTTQRLD